MKQFCLLVSILLMFTGCTDPQDELQHGMALRDRLMRESCSFTARITADFDGYSYSFSMGCSVNAGGELSFIVLEPESIAGISGKITSGSGFLTFEDTALAFPLLADGEISPVSAPWVVIQTLRAGYLLAAGKEDDMTRLTLHDSYEDDALQVDVWLDANHLPQSAEILWQGRRVLSIHIEEFTFV